MDEIGERTAYTAVRWSLPDEDKRPIEAPDYWGRGRRELLEGAVDSEEDGRGDRGRVAGNVEHVMRTRMQTLYCIGDRCRTQSDLADGGSVLGGEG